MMQPFSRHRGIAAPLQRANVDTDMIIRIERLMLVPRRDLGAYAFEMLRRRPDGTEDTDCILNQAPYRAASILVAGPNFGCGSSREAAVWALTGMGLRCVIAPSFGDIFRENCIKNGILPIVLDGSLCESLISELLGGEHGFEIEVDLEAMQLSGPSGEVLPFTIGTFERHQLLSGEDEVTTTFRRRDEILAHLARWSAEEPWTRLALDTSNRDLTPLNPDQGKTVP
jgi:3-isopropylmalate/(R)-2-methylmalate dehydratase small subunit